MENTSRKYWEQKISKWKSSELNICDWCPKSHTDVKQFYTWKNILEDSESESEETVFAEVTHPYQSRRQDYRVSSQDTCLNALLLGNKIIYPGSVQYRYASLTARDVEIVMLRSFINGATRI